VLAQKEIGKMAEEAGTFLDNMTVDDVAAVFPPDARKNIKANWPIIADSLKRWHLTSRELVLYAIGTIDAETRPTFSSGAELRSSRSEKLDKAGYQGIQDPGTVRPFGQYDSTIRFPKGKPVINKQLGNAYYRGKDDELMRARHGDPPVPDLNEGEKYRGRGFVQLTGKYNYGVMQRRVGAALDLDLLEEPEQAEDPATAADILACFLGSKRETIEKEMKAGNYRAARKAVNAQGLHWQKLQRVVTAYDQNQAKKVAKEAPKRPAPAGAAVSNRVMMP
jgi:hypothetical protein